MQNNICPECKTENEPEYRYCKNCGAPITGKAPAPAQPQPEYGAPEGDGNPRPGGVFIDGNPIEKVATFVGKNANKIVPKFIKMEERKTKVEWCLPPFLWGLFLGPMGIAIWFLYRKMYKHACIFGAVAVAVNYINAVLRTVLGVGEEAIKGIGSYIRSFFETGVFNTQGIVSLLSDRRLILNGLLNSFANTIYIACAVLSGLFGWYLYKRHAADRISRYVPITNDPNYYNIGLAAAGGTSPGAAILGAVIILLVSSLPNMVLAILRAVEVIYGL